MKVRSSCMKCNEIASTESFKEILIELRDDNVYEIECDSGHHLAIVLQENKFEILFEMGVIAFVDGYFRESVTSFAASLERLYEYYVNVITLHRDIEQQEFKKTWKHINNQSERQFGAFCFLYLVENGVTPDVLSTNSASLRNNVIHKGYFPSEIEALKYGEEVLKLMNTILLQLIGKYKPSVIELNYIKQSEARNRIKNQSALFISSSVPTSIRLSSQSMIGIKSLREMIEDRKDFRMFV